MELPLVYTIDSINQLEQEFRYTIYGQGISLIVVEASTAKRKTTVNELIKFGYENVYDAAKPLEVDNLIKKAEGTLALITSFNIPKSDGIKIAKTFLEKCPGSATVLVLDKEDKAVKQKAVDAGIAAVITRSGGTEEICNKLKAQGLGI